MAFLLAAFFIGGYSPCLVAQDASPSRAVPITATTRLVALDVVVTDAKGKPVDGLTEKDFQIFEDDKPQRIRSVEPPSAHRLPTASSIGGAPEVFDPAQPASFGLSPVTILLLDEANTHFADSSFARRQIHDYLSKEPELLAQPTTLLSVYDLHFKQLQGFTRDRDALLRALAAAPTRYAWNLELNGSTANGPIERLDQSLHALEQIAQSYARIAGRKNIVWVGGGFPTLDPNSIDGDDAREMKSTMQHVTNVLLETRVTLYAVDPSSSAVGMTEITDPTQLLFAMAAGDALTLGSDPFNSDAEFDKLAPVTGGRIVRGMNNVAQQIAASVELGANFYTLTYTPTSTSDTAAQYRKIKVICLKPGTAVTTRNGYYAGQTREEKSADTAAFDLTAAAEGSLPLNGLHISVALDHSLNASADTYVVRVSAADLTWKLQSDGASVASVYILAASLNGKRAMVGHTMHAMKATARSGTDLKDASRMADFAFTAPANSKAIVLRFVVRDSATGRMGSVDLPTHTR